MAKRPNLLESVLALSDEGIQTVGTFVDKARELDERIKDYKAGLYFPDLPRPDGQRVFPIIVTPTSWPRIYLLYSVLPKAIVSESLLEGCQPIELMDATDIELLEGGLQTGARLGALLDRKNGDGEPTDPRFKSLNDYLIFYERGLFSGVRRPGRERGAEIARSIIEAANAWWKQE